MTPFLRKLQSWTQEAVVSDASSFDACKFHFDKKGCRPGSVCELCHDENDRKPKGGSCGGTRMKSIAMESIATAPLASGASAVLGLTAAPHRHLLEHPWERADLTKQVSI